MNELLGSGLAFPLQVDRLGGIALAHAEEDIQEAIMIILGTAPGERPMRPEFGCAVHDYVFDAVDAYTIGRIEREVRAALDRWEPRVEVLDVDVDTSRVEGGELLIDIRYLVRATTDERNLVYPFYVIPAEESE